MNLIRSKSRVVSLLIFFLNGILYSGAVLMEPHNKPKLMLATFAVWIVSLFALLIFMPASKPKKVYTRVHMIMLIVLAFLEQTYFNEDYLVYLIFMMQWLMALMLVREAFLSELAITQFLAYIIMVYEPTVNSYTHYDYRSLILVAIAVLCARWIGGTLIKTIVQIENDRNEQEQSMDDMLVLVEKKHFEAKAATQSKSNFLSNMSHEIRTPINTVLGMNEMIQRESNDEIILGYSDNIKNAGSMLLNLVNDILDFSKIESGKMELVLGEYDLRTVVSDLYNMMKSRIVDKGLSFKIQVDPSIPSKYYGDDIRLRQIIINLLTNAAKYTNEGSVTLWIKGENRGDKELLHVCVEDTGIGIKKEDLDKLNHEFVRIDEKRNRNIEGTGLGITIVNSFLHLMDSNLRVSSVYEKGSKFYFDVEQPIVDKTPIGLADSFINKHTSKKKHEAKITVPDAKLLVVDDNVMNLKVFVALLKDNKCKIDTADSGKKAIELVKENKYDIIFMDHMMPEMDGIEALSKIREIPECINCDTPIYACTANAMAGAKEMYEGYGFAGFLTKPINVDKLEEILVDNLSN